jgi:hypothetical protein
LKFVVDLGFHLGSKFFIVVDLAIDHSVHGIVGGVQRLVT